MSVFLVPWNWSAEINMDSETLRSIVVILNAVCDEETLIYRLGNVVDDYTNTVLKTRGCAFSKTLCPLSL